MEKAQGTLKLVTKINSFYEVLVPVLMKFPKAQRYTLAQNIENETLTCIRLVYFAAYQKSQRLENLKTLRVNLHVVGTFLKLSSRLNLLGDNPYKQLFERLDEIGKIASQWIKTEEKHLGKIKSSGVQV